VKKIIIFLILLSNSFAEITMEEAEKALPSDYKNTKTIPPVKYTGEWSMAYFKYGFGILSIQDDKFESDNHSFGYRRYANSFFYGGEFSSISQKKKNFKQTGFQMHAGFQPQWKHRMVPYAAIHIGRISAKVNDKSLGGFTSSIDLGVNLSRNEPFLVQTGMRYGKNNYSSPIIKDSSLQEFYIIFAFEF